MYSRCSGLEAWPGYNAYRALEELCPEGEYDNRTVLLTAPLTLDRDRPVPGAGQMAARAKLDRPLRVPDRIFI